MFSSLASLLLLGAISPPAAGPVLRPLPGIEVLSIAAPAEKRKPLLLPERLSASGMLLLDLQSGETLLSRNENQRRKVASLTKIMTALLILENHNLNEIVPVPTLADGIRGSAVGLKAGEFFRIGDLLKALLIPSANDAAYALAIDDAGSVSRFVERMNKRASSLGLKNTHFTNPAGLDSTEQYSSVRDLSWLTIAALKHPVFRKIVSTKSGTIEATTGQSFDLRNTNELLHENPHVFGVKTGTTDLAGECLIVLFEEEHRPYLLVLIGSNDRYTDSLYLLTALRKALSENVALEQ